MNLVIIKYNAGNIMSVDYALQRLGINALVTDDPDLIRSADKVIFPGVGEANTTMKYLAEKKLNLLIPGLKQPVLGHLPGTSADVQIFRGKRYTLYGNL